MFEVLGIRIFHVLTTVRLNVKKICSEQVRLGLYFYIIHVFHK